MSIKKIIFDAAVAAGGAALGGLVTKHTHATVEQIGDKTVEKIKEKAPVVFEAAKNKASDAASAAKGVGQAAKRKFGR